MTYALAVLPSDYDQEDSPLRSASSPQAMPNMIDASFGVVVGATSNIRSAETLTTLWTVFRIVLAQFRWRFFRAADSFNTAWAYAAANAITGCLVLLRSVSPLRGMSGDYGDRADSRCILEWFEGAYAASSSAWSSSAEGC